MARVSRGVTTHARHKKVIKRARKLSESQIKAVLKYQDALFSNELADLLDVHVDTIRKIKREHSVQYEKVSWCNWIVIRL